MILRYLTAGESHGRALTGIVEGIPAGLNVSRESINKHLARRWLGYGRGGRAKFERDLIEIVSGIRFEKSMGSPITLSLENAAYSKDKSGWEQVMSVDKIDSTVDPVTLPRPGHADLVGTQKYHLNDIRPVIERASARETAIRVACCSVARLLLEELDIHVGSHVLSIGEASDEQRRRLIEKRNEVASTSAWDVSVAADSSEVRMLDNEATTLTIETIKAAKKNGDSLGGSYEVVVTGLIAGLGSYVQWDRKLDSQLAAAIISIQGQKAVEIGDGIQAAFNPGSEVHDPIIAGKGRFDRRTNHAGGIEGGVTTGQPIVIRGFMKPIPTLIKPLDTVDIASYESTPTRYERSDVTSVPAASTVAEAVVAFAIANAVLDKFGGDSMDELIERYQKEKQRQNESIPG